MPETSKVEIVFTGGSKNVENSGGGQGRKKGKDSRSDVVGKVGGERASRLICEWLFCVLTRDLRRPSVCRYGSKKKSTYFPRAPWPSAEAGFPVRPLACVAARMLSLNSHSPRLGRHAKYGFRGPCILIWRPPVGSYGFDPRPFSSPGRRPVRLWRSMYMPVSVLFALKSIRGTTNAFRGP